MITVRFASGFSVQYNDANFVERRSDYSDLYTQKGGRWVAQVPTTGCIVEVVNPCRAYHAGAQPTEQLGAFKQFLDARPSLGYSDAVKLAEIKRALRRFNGKTKGWR